VKQLLILLIISTTNIVIKRKNTFVSQKIFLNLGKINLFDYCHSIQIKKRMLWQNQALKNQMVGIAETAT